MIKEVRKTGKDIRQAGGDVSHKAYVLIALIIAILVVPHFLNMPPGALQSWMNWP